MNRMISKMRICFAHTVPIGARTQSAFQGCNVYRTGSTHVIAQRKLTSSRAGATMPSHPRMVGEGPVASFTEMLSRRGLLNNLITAGFVSLGLFVFFSKPKAVEADKEYRDPAAATVTSKVFFDISIAGEPAGRVVIGLFGDGKWRKRFMHCHARRRLSAPEMHMFTTYT